MNHTNQIRYMGRKLRGETEITEIRRSKKDPRKTKGTETRKQKKRRRRKLLIVSQL